MKKLVQKIYVPILVLAIPFYMLGAQEVPEIEPDEIIFKIPIELTPRKMITELPLLEMLNRLETIQIPEFDPVQIINEEINDFAGKHAISNPCQALKKRDELAYKIRQHNQTPDESTLKYLAKLYEELPCQNFNTLDQLQTLYAKRNVLLARGYFLSQGKAFRITINK